ncbi:MAG: site-specific DNA-methyltransferase [Planctomycetes bacterium]|nr:site-specific DNA-methyltransferase [Planctomycetota bacterium]
MRPDIEAFSNSVNEDALRACAPPAVARLRESQTAIPRLAKDADAVREIEALLATLPTRHEMRQGDARELDWLPAESVHLVLTSPPYWTLKEYNESEGQLGSLPDYEDFLAALDRVWTHCLRVLVPGGRLICVVGDVCLSRRKNNGRHTVVPLHASIQEHCRAVGFDNLAPIIWHKIANATLEASGNGGGFLGKPYEPNAVIKNDIEFILMQRKPGGYRSPSFLARAFSVIPDDQHKVWFKQIWADVPGASTRSHPAPFPLELAVRLIRMFSFVGDVVLDPFLGSGTTSLAAWQTGRNSIGVEIDGAYMESAARRFRKHTNTLMSRHEFEVVRREPQ